MTRQLRFPFPRAEGDEPPAATSSPRSDARDRDVFRHRLAIDDVPFRMPPRIVPSEQPELTRDQRRSRRHRVVKSMTLPRISGRDLLRGQELYPPGEAEPRPRTRAECAAVPRPCPFVACVHHLYLDVSARNGSIKVNFPDLEPDELPAEASCALDVADRAGVTLDEVGKVMNITRERVRQLEVRGTSKLRALEELAQLRDVIDGRSTREPVARRRLPLVPEIDPEAFASEELDDE